MCYKLEIWHERKRYNIKTLLISNKIVAKIKKTPLILEFCFQSHLNMKLTISCHWSHSISRWSDISAQDKSAPSKELRIKVTKARKAKERKANKRKTKVRKSFRITRIMIFHNTLSPCICSIMDSMILQKRLLYTLLHILSTVYPFFLVLKILAKK